MSSLPAGSTVKAIEADASSAESIVAAFKSVRETWPGAEIDVAVFNPGGTFKITPFLEADIEDLKINLNGGV